MPERPDVPAGTVLCLADGEWAYGRGPLVLRVDRVRWELAHHYGEERVWVEGRRVADDGTPTGAVQVLVTVAALRDRP